MYDLIIIGGGPAGYTGAISASKEGLTVALIEQDKLGGVCLNQGCIPTKSLLKSADIYSSSCDSAIFGVNSENVTYDMNKIFERKTDVVNRLVKGVEKLIDNANVTYIQGTAKFVSSNIIEVNGEQINAKKIIISTGGDIVLPPIKGIENALLSDDVLNGKATGDEIVIIGGGVIGVEFATFFAKLQKKVTIIELKEKILPSFDRDVSQNLSLYLRKLGVKMVCSAVVNEISQGKVKYTARGKQKEIECDNIIACTGRRANVKGLGLDCTDVEYNNNGIKVNQFQHTTDSCIYAVGDVVAGNIQLAHNATAEAQVAVHNIIHGDTKTKPKCVPSCVYTSPEVAIVGMSETELNEKGIKYDIGKIPMGTNGKAVLSGEDKGFMKVLFEKSTDKIIGVQLLSVNATDIIGSITTLVEIGVTREQILGSIYPHPTIVEAFYEAVLDSMGKAIHLINRRR